MFLHSKAEWEAKREVVRIRTCHHCRLYHDSTLVPSHFTLELEAAITFHFFRALLTLLNKFKGTTTSQEDP